MNSKYTDLKQYVGSIY